MVQRGHQQAVHEFRQEMVGPGIRATVRYIVQGLSEVWSLKIWSMVRCSDKERRDSRETPKFLTSAAI